MWIVKSVSNKYDNINCQEYTEGATNFYTPQNKFMNIW